MQQKISAPRALTPDANFGSIFKILLGGKDTKLVKLAGVQISCCEEKERNIEKAVKFARIASENGANLICFQELFNTHWFPNEMNKHHFSLAEGIDGPTVIKMRRVAQENDV